MSKIINLYGGSGTGKSTLSAGIFHALKVRGLNAELVHEYVKNWAWEGRGVGPFDQPYLSAKQIKAESRLFGKVDYIVTDSPVNLSAIYEQHYNKEHRLVQELCMNYRNKCIHEGHEIVDLMVPRRKEFFKKEGRFESLEQSLMIDLRIETYLLNNSINYSMLPQEGQIEFILKKLGVES